jgi:hypothetical protein
VAAGVPGAARRLFGYLTEVQIRLALYEHRAARGDSDRLALLLWLRHPVRSIRAKLWQARQHAPAFDAARAERDRLAAARDAVRLAMPGGSRAVRRARPGVLRELNAGHHGGQDVRTPRPRSPGSATATRTCPQPTSPPGSASPTGPSGGTSPPARTPPSKQPDQVEGTPAMSSEPAIPDPGDPLATPGDEVLEGEIIAFPRPASPAPQRRTSPGQPGELRRIIPEHLSTWAGIRKAARWRAGLVHRIGSQSAPKTGQPVHRDSGVRSQTRPATSTFLGRGGRI